MTLVPVFLDARPAYLGQECALTSQLLCPVADSALIAELYHAVRAVTSHEPYVLPAFTAAAGYAELLKEQCPAIEGVLQAEGFGDLLGRLDPSDALLFVSPACVPARPVDLRPLLSLAGGNVAVVRHLLAFGATTLGTKEYVQTGAEGRVRRIQRYFDPVTWPFPMGVIASVVPVSCFLMADRINLDSLMELRQAVTMRGLPSQDLPFHGECFDLNDEGGALALNEARLLERAGRRAGAASDGEEPMPAKGATVHRTARVMGTVSIHTGAVIEPDAMVIGPSVIGAGARICSGAVVAQCVVLPGANVPPLATVRHRVIVVRTLSEARSARPGQRRHASGPQRAPTIPQSQVWSLNYLQLKYMVEPLLAALVLALIMPVLVLLAILVKATSKGPIFYGDGREGKDGKLFRCWKFRTMLTNANDMQRALKAQQQMDGPQFKMDHDPRITALGHWLRRLNVDELPQIWNVVRGEMSFVGPRPSPFRENQICVPWRHGRLSVRPGITGLWQVCRHDRALGDFHQWIHYDMLYVRNVSLVVDAKIFAYTILTLGGRRPVSLARVIGTEASKAQVDPLPRVRIAPVVVPFVRNTAATLPSSVARFTMASGTASIQF